jgi:hypothetical protein
MITPLQKSFAEPSNYFTFDMTADGHLKSKSRTGRLMLSFLYLLQRDYTAAQKFMKGRSVSLQMYSKEEVSLIEEIALAEDVTGDQSHEACEVRINACALLR